MYRTLCLLTRPQPGIYLGGCFLLFLFRLFLFFPSLSPLSDCMAPQMQLRDFRERYLQCTFAVFATSKKKYSKTWSLTNCINFTAMFSWNVCINKVKLILHTVNYLKNIAWKFDRKVQNHCDNTTFCAGGSFLLPHPLLLVKRHSSVYSLDVKKEKKHNVGRPSNKPANCSRQKTENERICTHLLVNSISMYWMGMSGKSGAKPAHGDHDRHIQLTTTQS